MRHMNLWYMGAAAMMLATAAIHAFAGGPGINAPIQASELHEVVRAVSAVIWHALTALFVIFAVALARAARGAAREASAVLVWTILAVCLAFAGLFVGMGYALLGSLVLMPQWVIFVAIAGVLRVGLSRHGNLSEAHG